MPLFDKPIILKAKGKEKYIFTGYNVYSRDQFHCKNFDKVMHLKLKHLEHTGVISKHEYIILNKGYKQWCKDESHAVIQVEYYDVETNTKHTTCHNITRQEAAINREPTIMEYKDGKDTVYEKPLKILNNLHVTAYGSITDINKNDPFLNNLNLIMDLNKLIFDEDKGYYVGPDGKQWSNLTRENTDLIAQTLVKKFQDDGFIRKYDKTDLLYIDNAILKVKVLEEDISQKDIVQIDKAVTEIENKLKIPDFLIAEVKNSNSLIIKKGLDSDILQKAVTGIKDEE